MEALGVGLGLRAKTRARPRLRRTVVRVTASGNAGGGSKRKGKKQGGAFSTVEAAVSFLAQLLSAGDMFGTTGSSFKSDGRFDHFEWQCMSTRIPTFPPGLGCLDPLLPGHP